MLAATSAVMLAATSGWRPRVLSTHLCAARALFICMSFVWTHPHLRLGWFRILGRVCILGRWYVLAPASSHGKPQRRNYEGGVDVVINFTGGDTWVPSLRCLKRGGKLLVCGATAGHDPKEDLRFIWSFEQSFLTNFYKFFTVICYHVLMIDH
jgi:hypothetical protein